MKTVTGMGGMGGARELAEMLRQMGRGRDTVLAHITPEEAQMLLEQGGAGTMNPMTGLPEFQDDYFGSEFDPYGGQQVTSTTGGAETLAQGGGFTQGYDQFAGMGGGEFVGPMQQSGFDLSRAVDLGQAADFYGMQGPTYAGVTSAPTREDISAYFGAPQAEAQAQQPGFLDQLGRRVEAADAYLRERPGLAKVLGFGAQGLVGYLQAQRARAQGAEEARRFSKLGRPLKEQGEALRTQALAGQLTPQQAASQQARLASMRQAGANRGVTTGTQQAMIENQLARERAQLSETNLNNALKMLNLANAYDEAAIRARLASDREADDLLSNILTNIGFNVASGIRRQQQQPQQEITRRPEIPRGA